MSTAPGAAAAGSRSADVPSPTRVQRFQNCWSCRVVSGGGLILSAAYVFHAARRVMKQGGMTSMGTVAQITFAAGKTDSDSGALMKHLPLEYVFGGRQFNSNTIKTICNKYLY